MELTQETIIGILTGSVATITIKGIIDYFNKKVEFRRELKKNLYGKKLEAAEHGIKAMFQSYQSAVIIANAIDSLLTEEIEGDLFENIWQSYFNLMDEGETRLLNSSASLYFKMHNNALWSNKDQKEFLKLLSNVKIYGEHFKSYKVELEKINSKKELKRVELEIEDKFRGAIRNEFEDLSKVLKKYATAQFNTIEEIKSEFTKDK